MGGAGAGTESRIYAGLRPGTTEATLRQAIADEGWRTSSHASRPSPATASSSRLGTVHALGGDIVVFEVQENSDVTFRLYDLEPCRREDRQTRRTPGRSGACLH